MSLKEEGHTLSLIVADDGIGIPSEKRDLLTSLELARANHINEPNSGPLALTQANDYISSPLSEREFEILSAMRSGKTNIEHAEILFLSVNTIKTHLQKLYSKMALKNRTKALFMMDKILKDR